MSNAQSNDSLRELNAKLLAEIAEHRKKFAEIKVENDELKDKNAEIVAFSDKIAELEVERTELKARIAGLLRQSVEENKMRDAENAKLKARIEELEKNRTDTVVENAELRDRVTKLEQKQTQNNISSNIQSSKPKSLEDKEIDVFLDSENKKKKGNEIRQRNREKKFLYESAKSQTLDLSLVNDQNHITEISATGRSQNSHQKKGTEKIIQVISDGIQDDVGSENHCFAIKHQGNNSLVESTLSRQELNSDLLKDVLPKQNRLTEISATGRGQKFSLVPLLTLAQLFDKATDAEYGAMRANQEEIIRWHFYGKEFVIQYNDIIKNGNGKIGEKKAKGIVYDKILEHLSIIREKRSKEIGLRLPEISRKHLQGKTQRAVKIYKLFEKIGIDKIKYIATYSANSISELTNDKIQEIIDHFSKNSNIEFTDDNRDKDKSINDSSDDLPETKVSIPTKSQTFNSSSSKVKVSISTESQISDSFDSKKLPELLIKNESDIDALIILLQQKFKMSKERLEQWRDKIAFELRDNQKYWKKERESMSEADFLEYKRNFEAKMGVPTTPHKKELKVRSLALIEYA